MRAKRIEKNTFYQMRRQIKRCLFRLEHYAKNQEVSKLVQRVLTCGNRRNKAIPAFYCTNPHWCIGCSTMRNVKFAKQVMNYLEAGNCKHLYTFLRKEYLEVKKPEDLPQAMEVLTKRSKAMYKAFQDAVEPAEGLIHRFTLCRKHETMYAVLTTLIFYRKKRVRTALPYWENTIVYEDSAYKHYAELDYFRKVRSLEQVFRFMQTVFQVPVATLKNLEPEWSYAFYLCLKGKKRWNAGGKIFFGTSDYRDVHKTKIIKDMKLEQLSKQSGT